MSSPGVYPGTRHRRFKPRLLDPGIGRNRPRQPRRQRSANQVITGASSRYGLAVDGLSFPETTITSGPDGLTNNASPSFAFNSDHPGTG